MLDLLRHIDFFSSCQYICGLGCLCLQTQTRLSPNFIWFLVHWIEMEEMRNGKLSLTLQLEFLIVFILVQQIDIFVSKKTSATLSQ